MGLDRVDQGSCRVGVFPPELRTATAEDRVEAVFYARVGEAQKLLPRFLCRMALVHVLKRRVQTALHADVQTADAALVQAAKVGVRLVPDVLDGGVHGDGFHPGQLCVDRVGNLDQTICGEHKGVTVLQEYPLHIGTIAGRFIDVRLHLFHRTHRKRNVRVHIAKGAFVVAAALRHLQEQRIGLIGRPVNHSCQAHCSLPPFI